MMIYRVLTGVDDAAFCHRITEALYLGWKLYGSPSLTYVVTRQATSAAGDHKEVPDRLTIRRWTSPRNDRVP